MRDLIVSFSDGSRWIIPANFIASQVAEHKLRCAKEHNLIRFPVDWEFLIDLVNSIKDLDIIAWAKINMDWKDVERYALRLDPRVCSYDNEWRNAEMEVITRDSQS